MLLKAIGQPIKLTNRVLLASKKTFSEALSTIKGKIILKQNNLMGSYFETKQRKLKLFQNTLTRFALNYYLIEKINLSFFLF